MHSRLYLLTLMIVGLWTVNIHDRMTLRLWGVNGAAHHTVHHVKFNYNFGQYFTWSDHVFGTYKNPYQTWPYELDETQLDKLKAEDQAEARAGKHSPPQISPVGEEEAQKKGKEDSKKAQ